MKIKSLCLSFVLLLPVVLNGQQGKFRKATLHSPEHDPQQLDLARYGKGWMTVVPAVKTYGIVVFE